MKCGNNNIVGIIGLLGAILLIVSVFLTWTDISVSSIIGGKTESFTGMDIYSNDDGWFDDLSYGYAPIVALIAGIVALITTIVPMFYKNDKVWKVMGVLSLVLGIVAVILGFLFKGDVTDSINLVVASASVEVGIGLWLAVAGGILLILGAIIDIVKKNA